MTPLGVLKTVISRLDELGIPHMVIGSFASSAYGLLRTTHGADIIVDLKVGQAGQVVEAFRRDFCVDAGQVEQAITGKRSFNVIHLEVFFKVDFFVLADTKFAREEFSRRNRWPLGAQLGEVCVATPEDVLLSKLRWYLDGGQVSEVQWRDVIAVVKTQAGKLDWLYLRRWAQEPQIVDLLERARQEAGVE